MTELCATMVKFGACRLEPSPPVMSENLDSARKFSSVNLNPHMHAFREDPFAERQQSPHVTQGSVRSVQIPPGVLKGRLLSGKSRGILSLDLHSHYSAGGGQFSN